MTPEEGWVESLFKFQRVFVALRPGIIKITVQNALENYPLYAAVDYRLKMAGGALVAKPVGATIGRLALPRRTGSLLSQAAQFHPFPVELPPAGVRPHGPA